MENQLKLNNIKELITFLAEHFPQCFSTKGIARPLKIGIFQDLVERVVEEKTKPSKTQLRLALRFYTSSWRYLYGIKTRAIRVDLDGNASGQLDERHVRYARQRLKEAKARTKIRSKRQSIEKYENNLVTNTPKLYNPLQTHKKQALILSSKENENHNPYLLRSHFKLEHLIPVINTSVLQVGQNIKIATGTRSTIGVILEITKDGVRLQLTSGLAIKVRAEHLQF